MFHLIHFFRIYSILIGANNGKQESLLWPAELTFLMDAQQMKLGQMSTHTPATIKSALQVCLRPGCSLSDERHNWTKRRHDLQGDNVQLNFTERRPLTQFYEKGKDGSVQSMQTCCIVLIPYCCFLCSFVAYAHKKLNIIPQTATVV